MTRIESITWAGVCERNHEVTWRATPETGSSYECAECTTGGAEPAAPVPVYLEPGSGWGWLRNVDRRRRTA